MGQKKMRSFACSYASRRKTASRIFAYYLRVSHYSPAVAPLNTDAYRLLFHSRRPSLRFRAPATTLRLLRSTPASRYDFTAACHRGETHTKREPPATATRRAQSANLALAPWRDTRRTRPQRLLATSPAPHRTLHESRLLRDAL